MVTDDCIFCKIAGGEIPAKIVFRNDKVLAVEDVNPQAPVHLLVMPIQHYDSLLQVVCDQDTEDLQLGLIEAAATLGQKHSTGGYRIVVNTGHDGGQTVGHLHIHVLAGRRMTWPPG
jgi:histidine triad (HIT) family protein